MARPVAICAVMLFVSAVAAADEPRHQAELVFQLNPQHNHAPGIVECPNGDLLASWYRGSGERSADDVAVYGARLRKGESKWSDDFLMADFPNFPDCNTCMMVDGEKRLWLFWPTVLANSWESCLTNYFCAKEYSADGPPQWDHHGLVLLKPDDFKDALVGPLEKRVAELPEGQRVFGQRYLEAMKTRSSEKLYQRLGWQPRCKPTVLPSGRILLPLYTDTFSISIMAVSDDAGRSWYASKPLIGYGNIQPTVLRRNDGTLVAYMRENGLGNNIRVCESKDDGITWGEVGNSELPNPGAGIDGVRLSNGHWVLIYNDTVRDRKSLAVSISEDEGQTWKKTRHLEKHDAGSYHYPAIIQAADGTIHAIYSYFVQDGKSMKHAAFNEEWIAAGDTAE